MDIARSTTKLFVARIIGAVLTFGGITFFARELGAEQMGIFFLFQALLGILAIPADLGVRQAVEKRISEGESPSGVLTTGLLLKFVPLFVISLGVLLFRDQVNEYLGAELAMLLILAIFIQELAKLMKQTLNGELRVGETAVLRLSRQVSWVSVGGVLILADFSTIGLVYGIIVGYTVMLVWGSYKRSTPFGRPSVKQARSLFSYAKFDAVSGAGARFYNWMDVAIVGYFLTQELVGAYEIAWKVTGFTILFVQALGTVIFPQVSAWDAENETGRIESLLPTALISGLFLVIPSFFGVLIFSEEILSIVFGTQYAAASLVMIVFMLQKIMQAVDDVVGRSLQATDHPDLAAYGTIAGVVLNIILNVVLVLYFGILGAAIATFVSHSAMVILHVFYLSKFINIQLPYRLVAWSTLSASIMTLVLLGIKRIVRISSLIEISFAVLAGAIVYFVLILFNSEFRSRIVKTAQDMVV